MDSQRLLSLIEPPLRGTVLVVDDDKPTCQLLSDMVRLLGFDVMIAYGAEEGLAVMREHPIDVAFCDIVMPGRDGVWLIDQIRRTFPATAIVVATGLTSMSPSVTLAPAVAAYLVKPFDMDDVASAIGSALSAIGEMR